MPSSRSRGGHAADDEGSEVDAILLNRTWRPALSITGADGMPPLGSAGNVLRPFTTVKLSLRMPPTASNGKARARRR